MPLFIPDEEPTILRLPRAREVGQSWISSAYTTFVASLAAMSLVYRNRPRLLVTASVAEAFDPPAVLMNGICAKSLGYQIKQLVLLSATGMSEIS